ncbi:hypothetical protein CMV30_10080 [Nibricoccus aquaticus]|uniref:DUF4130 domain-containing protein n=1 Tax=Nibricoccus aquaticus TaxID=2576891 RepID=A0A290QDE9_9BACT|nr:TIGR03915 family putative DNA repair protein [Nibricoccus aquaticus]ATC64276.1 hypothetical protein CMV30_10080 [Nibricoccus aquaticus]
MQSIPTPEDYLTWTDTARALLTESHPPDQVLWLSPDEFSLWFVSENSAPYSVQIPPSPSPTPDSLCPPCPSSVPSVVPSENPSSPSHTSGSIRVPREFPTLARLVAAHAAPNRWEILYRVLWRLTHGEPQLLHLFTDPDVHTLRTWEKAVRRELHKLTAFVRFRQVRTDTGADHYIAWYEPEHDVIALGAPFFRRRFASMNWSILSPRRCIHWDGTALRESPGVPRTDAPTADTLEPLWLTYYASIFNPARLKINAMLREMPKRYWANLPEADLIKKLIADATPRTDAMLAASHLKSATAQSC